MKKWKIGGSNMNKILALPNLNADIIPKKSAGGYEIGMNFDDFIGVISNNMIYQNNQEVPFEIKQDCWVIEVFADGKFASWSDVIILRFGLDDKLNCITLKDGYQGKFLQKAGINDRLDVLIDDFYFLFYADVHLLSCKNKNRSILDKYIFDNELYEIDIDNDFDVMSIIYDVNDVQTVDGIEFHTNYLTQYSKEYNNQIIQSISVFYNK